MHDVLKLNFHPRTIAVVTTLASLPLDGTGAEDKGVEVAGVTLAVAPETMAIILTSDSEEDTPKRTLHCSASASCD